MTRAPSPCSADSSSEASAKEDATQGKPTDDELPAEIEAAFEAYGIACYSAGGEADGGDTMAEQVALKNAILAALRASQENERIAVEGQVVAVDVGAKHAERRMAAEERAEIAEAALRAAQADARRLELMLECKRRAIERYIPCPDCRDKVQAGECQRCARQTADRRAEAAERERDALREALGKYGIHTASCEWPWRFDHDPSKCTCGLFAALAPRPPPPCSAEATQGKSVKEE